MGKTQINSATIHEHVEGLIKASKYKQALAELSRISASKLELGSLARHFILISQANYSLGSYDETHINKSIDISRDSNENELFARAKSLKGRIKIAKGEENQALELLNESYVTFKRCDNKRAAATVLNRMAHVYRNSGDVITAINIIKKCIGLLKDLNSDREIKQQE